MSNAAFPDWDPRDVSVLHDQRLAYDEMRERCPVAHDDFLNWSLFRHESVVNVLGDPETFSSVSAFRAVPNGMDSSEHTRYASIIEPYFRSGHMAALEPHCRSIAADLLQVLLKSGGDVEFVTEFAQPFSYKTLCSFLGWPSERWENLRDWGHGNQEQAFSGDKEAGAALAREFTGYVTEALQVRRAAGTDRSDDITTSLMESTIEDVTLSDNDIVSMLRNWTASGGTVAAALGIVVAYLAEHADLQQQLRREPALVASAIEEILRVDGPLVANRRTATRDVEIEGKKIAAGEKLALNWIAANRDGRAFDNADVVRVDRDPKDNLLFGAGIHYCLGAPLARLEMRVAIEELLAETTTIELGTTGPLQRDLYPSNGFQAVPLRLC